MTFRPRKRPARVVGGFTTERLIQDVERRLEYLEAEVRVLRRLLTALRG